VCSQFDWDGWATKGTGDGTAVRHGEESFSDTEEEEEEEDATAAPP
jgi:hypothetical protein